MLVLRRTACKSGKEQKSVQHAGKQADEWWQIFLTELMHQLHIFIELMPITETSTLWCVWVTAFVVGLGSVARVKDYISCIWRQEKTCQRNYSQQFTVVSFAEVFLLWSYKEHVARVWNLQNTVRGELQNQLVVLVVSVIEGDQTLHFIIPVCS